MLRQKLYFNTMHVPSSSRNIFFIHLGRVRSNLNVHIKLHTGIKDHICKICGKGFAFKQKVNPHSTFYYSNAYVIDKEHDYFHTVTL